MDFPGPGKGFLQNNGKANADLGDYKGQCLAEPQKCQPVLSVGFWFKYPLSSNYKKEVYLGTASLNENSQGFALYMDPVDKQTNRFAIKVSNSKMIWRCHFKQPSGIWTHLGFIWKAKTGLMLYKDCSLICTNNLGVNINVSTPMRPSPDANHFFLGRGNGLRVFKDVKASFDDLAVWYQRLRAKDIGGGLCKHKLGKWLQLVWVCSNNIIMFSNLKKLFKINIMATATYVLFAKTRWSFNERFFQIKNLNNW